MAERKFTRGLSKPGMAAQLRESVSQVVRETAVQSKPQRIEPNDYESVLTKNKIIFYNDPHRELLLFPPDDIVQSKIPRVCRTTRSTVPSEVFLNESNYFILKCAQFFISEWTVVTYKYSAYSGSYLALPRVERPTILPDPKHEMDVEGDLEEDLLLSESPPTIEGYLLKGPEGANEKAFVNIATKSFKRRFCKLRQDITGSYCLDICKEEKKLEVTTTICLDECVEILRNVRRNKFGFQLRLTNQRSYVFAASSETELNSWLEKLMQAVHSSKIVNDEKKLPDLEMNDPPSYGTLRSLESSLNPQLTKYARETEISISMARKELRNLLFTLCPLLPSLGTNDGFLLNHSKVEPLTEKFGHRFAVQCESISFRLMAPINGDKGPLGQVEPYLTTMALYDIKMNKKITEDFHFDVNEPHMKKLIESIQDDIQEDSETLSDFSRDWLSFPKQAIFSVSNCHSDVFLVIRIETILQGSIVNSIEPYIKPHADWKTGLKVQKSAKSFSTK